MASDNLSKMKSCEYDCNAYRDINNDIMGNNFSLSIRNICKKKADIF